jgi:PKD repeat protein
MQKTANQIKSEFELLASGHYQIHSFLYAQEFEQQAYENLIYPLMLVYPLGGSLSGTSYTRNYRVVIADRVLKSEGNELEVESDTQLIALDTLAYWMKLGTNERFSITSSNTITPFWEKWGDEVTGHFVDIGIEEFYDFNSCAIPLSSAIASPVNPCKDARILINSVIYGNAPSDTNFNVVVKDQLGALVGSLIGGEWIVNTGGACADATYTIEDSLGNVLYTGTIPSGGSVTEVIGNSTLNVNKSDGTLISSESILAEGTDSYNVADSSAVLKDEDGNVLSTTPIKATETEDIVAPNGDVSVNSVAFDDVLSGGTLNIEVLKSTGNDQIGSKQGQYWRIGDSTITNFDSSYDVDVKATESLVLPDSQINVNGVDEGDVVSVKTIDVNLEDSLGDPVTPTSVGLVGNTLTIEVPSGATPMNVDFSADKLTAAIAENITFTDLSDQTPTHWSWEFSDGTTSIVQNPVKSFLSTGFKNITLLSGKVGAGGVNVKNSYIEIISGLLLNDYPNAAAAYSLRKLRSAYTGDCIRVRRSSDNTEQNIGFVGDVLDTTALISFVGAGNGFVTTWYDQSGSGYNATQSTAANQPQIVASGALITDNGKPTIDYYNTTCRLQATATSLLTAAALSTFEVFSSAAAAAADTNTIVTWGLGDIAVSSNILCRFSSTGAIAGEFMAYDVRRSLNGLERLGSSSYRRLANTQTLETSLILSTGTSLYQDNNLQTLNLTSAGAATTTNYTPLNGAITGSLWLGSFFVSPSTHVSAIGKFSEMVFYSTDKTTDRIGITANINDYYNVF